MAERRTFLIEARPEADIVLRVLAPFAVQGAQILSLAAEQGAGATSIRLEAGGLGADNCVEAAKSGCAGLDFNSGVESQPGMKDASKLASVFQTLRAY